MKNSPFLMVLAILGTLLALLYLVAFLGPKPRANHGAFPRDRVLNIAHRGGALEAPENTLEAFRLARENGADVFEMDLHLTTDGVLFLMHDDTLDRTTNGQGSSTGRTWAEISALDAAYHWNPEGLDAPPLRGQGYRVPSLESLFREFPRVPMVIELKEYNFDLIPALGELINRYGRNDTTVVASFYNDMLQEYRRQFPAALTSASESEIRNFYLLSWVALEGLVKPPVHSFQIPESSGPLYILSGPMRASRVRWDLDYHVWTINEREDMERIVALGVQGIITDRPALLAGILASRNN